MFGLVSQAELMEADMFKESKGYPGYEQSTKRVALRMHVDECQSYDEVEFTIYCGKKDIDVERIGVWVLLTGTFPAILTMLADTFYYDAVQEVQCLVARIKEVV